MGLNRPDLVLDEDNVPFPFQHPEYMDEFCKISWASGHDVLGSLLPSWYDDWCSDVRSPEELPPTRWQQEKILFEPLTGEQLSLLESAEQVPVPWDMCYTKEKSEGGTTNLNLEKPLNFSEGRNISVRNEE